MDFRDSEKNIHQDLGVGNVFLSIGRGGCLLQILGMGLFPLPPSRPGLAHKYGRIVFKRFRRGVLVLGRHCLCIVAIAEQCY